MTKTAGQAAVEMLDRMMGCDPATIVPNGTGEIDGLGPVWACARYATSGHNYFTCRDCFSGFTRHMDAKEAA
jgi:hypothetical protein